MSTEDGPAWDFYPCHLDGGAASIFLDLRFEHGTRPPTANTLYRVRVQMLEPDEHGMGTETESTAFSEIEDVMSTRASQDELIYVGRIRSGGIWELAFYGPADRKDTLQAIRDLFVGRRTYADVRPDVDWGYYREFLVPDDERRQWMEDRRLTDVLLEHGDPLTTPRRVDHWAYFASAEARDRYVTAAKQAGFALEQASQGEQGERPFVAQLHRVDSVELEQIHDAVMRLHDLAKQEGGDYDGWESQVERA
ncbi:MAG TPA: DUF695 domain-containing protein [Kofleriaceae bacterium]